MSDEIIDHLHRLGPLLNSELDQKQKKIRDIYDELIKLNVDEQIVVQANNIYRAMARNNGRGIIIRSNKRNRLLFYCLFYAYYELGIKEEPYTLARRYGFNLKIVKEAFKNFSSPAYGYEPPIIINTTEDIVPVMCRYFKIDALYVKIISEMAHEIDNSQINIIKPQRWVMTLIHVCSQLCSARLNVPNNVDIVTWCQDIGIKYSSIKNNLRQIEINSEIKENFKTIVEKYLS